MPIQIRIQGFDDPKIEQNFQLKKLILGQQTTIHLFLASIQDVQATEEEREQKRTSGTSKHEIS
jgi:hypothetical protein